MGTQDRSENAIVFLENLERVKQNKHLLQSGGSFHSMQKRGRKTVGNGSICGMSMLSNDTAVNRDDGETSSIRQQNQDVYNSESGFESLDPVYEEGNGYDGTSDDYNEDEILLNVNPKKFEKPKDQLFIDFFSMYTKKFVEEEKSGNKSTQMSVQNMSQKGQYRKNVDNFFQHSSQMRTTAPQVMNKARMGGNQRVRLAASRAAYDRSD